MEIRNSWEERPHGGKRCFRGAAYTMDRLTANYWSRRVALHQMFTLIGNHNGV
jgi:hypothetical protein